jgi:hypothetical protein
LLEQLRKVASILSDNGQDDGMGAKVTTEGVVRSRRPRDRFSSEDLQNMIDLYRSGAPSANTWRTLIRTPADLRK